MRQPHQTDQVIHTVCVQALELNALNSLTPHICPFTSPPTLSPICFWMTSGLCALLTQQTHHTTEIHHTEEILSGYSRVWDGEGSQTAVEPEWEKERAQCTLQNEQSSQQLLLQSIHYDWKHNNCLKFCYTTFFNLNCLNQTRMRSSYFLCV